MARQRAHLDRAPIAEALIDFRVLPANDIKPDAFSNLQQSIGNRYSQANPIQSIQARFGVEGQEFVKQESRRALHGWIYKAGSDIAQFKIDGFTFSRIEPYTTWDQVFGEAFRLWQVYATKAKPKQISRLAVRYINRMRINGPTNLADYLAAPPELPKPIPQTIREFLSRTRIDAPESAASAVVVQALEPQIDPSIVSLILDIDAYRDGPPLTTDDPNVPIFFQTLRALKNQIFFAMITERTAEMYE